MLRLTDYTLDLNGADWSDLLASWAWLLPGEFTVWFANRFGDLFIAFGDGTIHRMDIGVGSLERVAENRDSFADALGKGNNANDWLMIPLVDKLVAAGVVPGPEECYSYVQLPVLGGDYSVANTLVVSIARHYKAFGPIHEKIKDMPDGTHVKFEETG